MEKHKLAIIGTGALGGIIGKEIKTGLSKDYELLGILGRDIEKTRDLADKIDTRAYENLEEIFKDKPDFLIEAANTQLIKDIGIKILENKINLIILSSGALADKDFYKDMEETAKRNKTKVYVPSGAVGGFDVLRAVTMMEETESKITTEKNPKSLNGAPYLEGRALSEEVEEDVFKGTAEEAIKHFPKNVNVAVATALATNGVENTQVIIKSKPAMDTNKHRIDLSGSSIRVSIEIESRPSEANPKSSSLAAWSVIGLLKNLVSPICF